MRWEGTNIIDSLGAAAQRRWAAGGEEEGPDGTQSRRGGSLEKRVGPSITRQDGNVGVRRHTKTNHQGRSRVT